MTGISKDEVQRIWESAAKGYAAWDEALGLELAPATQMMFDMAGATAGMRVLDVACGSGQQSLLLAERLGEAGQVLATDISETMLGFARERAQKTGMTNIETLRCAAEDLSCGENAFDAATCRLGLMLFPAPDEALSAIYAALKPGARFAGLVFAAPEANPFMAETLGILLRHAGKELPQSGEPGIFALSAPGAFEELLRAAGFADIEARGAAATLRLASAEQAIELMQQAFGVYRAAVADLGERERAAAWEEVAACLGQWNDASGFAAKREFTIAAGIKRP
jgi:ubiquinone/menaquinone biosynthesis C-methylase UbiE